MRPPASFSPNPNPNPERRGDNSIPYPEVRRRQQRRGQEWFHCVKGRVAERIGSTTERVKNNGSTDGNKDNNEKANELMVTERRKEEKWFNMRGRTTDSKGRNFVKLLKRAMFIVEKGHYGMDCCLSSSQGKSLSSSPPHDDYMDDCSSQSLSLWQRPYMMPLLSLILAFSGDLGDVGRCCVVCRGFAQYLSSDYYLWKWCVRWGELLPNHLSRFWRKCYGTGEPMTSEFYKKLVREGFESKWQDDIALDVSRVYSNFPNISTDDVSACADVLDHCSELFFGDRRLQTILDVILAVMTTVILLATAAVDAGENGVGYAPGMSFVVTGLLACIRDGGITSELAEEECFSLFNILLHSYGLNDVYRPGMLGLRIRCLQFTSLVKMFLPDVHNHFKALEVELEMFSVSWLQTGFWYMDAFPEDTRRLCWTIFLYERDWKIFFRVALALLKIAESELLMLDFDGVLAWFSTYPDAAIRLSRERVIKTALDMKVTRSLISKLKTYWEAKLMPS